VNLIRILAERLKNQANCKLHAEILSEYVMISLVQASCFLFALKKK